MHKFSFTTAKFLSSLIIATVLITIFCFARVSTLKQLRDYSINNYEVDFHKFVNGSMAPFEYVPRYYSQFLAFVHNTAQVESGNVEQISANIRRTPLMKPQFFADYGYISPEGKAVFSDGKLRDISDSSIFEKIKTDTRDVFFTDSFTSDTQKVFAIVQKAFGKDEQFKGYVCALIQVSGFQMILGSVKTGVSGDVIYIDSEGDEIYSRNQIAASLSEKEAYQFFPIPMTTWRLGVKLPQKAYLEDFYQQRNTEVLFLIVTVFVILAMLTVEMFIFRYLQKREIILSSYDQLTGLMTRTRFEARSRNFMRRNPSSKVVVIEADIRGFKFINQNYGCYAADQLIHLFGTKIKNMSIALKGWCGRGYADHFYICAKIDSVRNVMKIVNQEINRINAEIKSSEIPFFVKFGLSFSLPQKGESRETIESLIGQASFAKASIKDDTLTSFAIYNSRTAEKIRRERTIESKMEEALENGEFYVVYQPKIQLSTEKIVGAEALVRWKNPTLGLLSPDQFIPLFEKNGFVKKLDFYVYEEVFKFLHYLKENNLPLVPVSINMSRKHNSPDRFIHDFMEIFRRYDISPSLVQVELLEHSVMEKTDLLETTELLHKEGFTVAIDDFGTGESSLTMLSKIPVDVLKFDKSFLQESMSGPMDIKTQKFIRGLIEISKELDKMTVFEGVETEEQKNFLKENNCDLVQGYYYSKPLVQEDFEKFLVSHV